VGKSALFNRIAGRRLAIVHAESGVTRDRVVTEAIWKNRRFALVDTGGIGLARGERSRDVIETAMVEQARLAIETADLILFTVDAAVGVTSLDEEVADRLRVAGKPVVIVANKADNEARAADADSDFAQFGFDGPVAVSAVHGIGVADLLDEVIERLPDRGEEPGRRPDLKLALLGRPNVGKSSLLNRILNEERAIVSPVPGTTRDAIDVPVLLGGPGRQRPILLIDTAGLKRHVKTTGAVERIGSARAEAMVRRCDLGVLVLDAREGLGRQDQRVASLIVRHQRGCVLAVNKWDLVPNTERRAWEAAMKRKLPFLRHAPVFFVSARTGNGIPSLLEGVEYVAGQIDGNLPTPLLNRVVGDAMQRTQPPLRRGRRLRIYYAVQVGTRPPAIRLFVNDPRAVDRAWQQFLERRIRSAFGLEGAPLAFQWRRRSRKSSPAKPIDEDPANHA
jgi:GTP-binding protein